VCPFLLALVFIRHHYRTKVLQIDTYEGGAAMRKPVMQVADGRVRLEMMKKLEEVCSVRGFEVYTTPRHYAKHVLVFWKLGTVLVFGNVTANDLIEANRNISTFFPL